MPLAEARIPVLDRGFIFGDGVYEVIPVYSRHPFRLAEHLERLQTQSRRHPARESVARRGMDPARPRTDRAQRGRRSVDLSSGHARRGQARSRVSAERETDRVRDEQPAGDAREGRDREWRRRASPPTDFRWLKCDVKSTSLLGNCLLRQAGGRRRRAGSRDVPRRLSDRGSASNVFVVQNGVLLAPPKNHLMLPGITYDVVIELASANELPHELRESPKTKFATRTKSGSPRRPRKCSR